MLKRVCTVVVLVLIILVSAFCERQKPDDLRGELAAVAGRMAAEDDLRGVRFEDLNNDGVREVILVFGPRELLDFDVFYRGRGDRWSLTPMVNDQNNPREFIGARLDSIRDTDGDDILEIRVSSLLYDGNLMVKELHWSPTSYRVISQETMVIMPEKPPKPSRAAGETSKEKAGEKVAPPPKPKPKPIPPLRPSTGTYLVKKGDTVYGIAGVLDVSIEQLETMNGNQLQSRGLRIGQKIDVPVPRGKRENVTVRIEKERYTVLPGDNLTSIAQKYDASVRALKSWNHQLPADGALKAGQRLYIHKAVVDITS